MLALHSGRIEMPMRINKKLLSVLAACLAVVMLPVGALAAFSASLLENPTYAIRENGFTYLEQELNEGGVQKLFYGEYNANSPTAEYEWVIHSIRDGSETTLSTVMDIAKDYESQTGKKVMVAANGDYFYATGANVESYVNDGIVISKGPFAHKHCIGFDNEGKVVVGRMTEVEPRLVVVLDGDNTFFEVDSINKEPGENGVAVYTQPGTYTVKGAGKYICGTESSNLSQYPFYGTSRRMSTGSVENDDSFTLKSGQFAVVVKGEPAQFFFDNVIFGVEVNMVEIPAGDFAGCTWVLGGYDILVDDGKVNTNCHTDNGGDGKAPRTFIGFKPDGTGFICMVDGRQSGYSVGITVNKEAELAKALGAQFALELDGGGSTTVIVRINDTLTLRNKPSDGAMRRVSNAILLVQKEKEEPEPPAPTDPEPTTPATPPATAPTTLPATNPATTPSTNVQTSADDANGENLIWVIAAVIGVVFVLVVVLTVVGGRKRKKQS